MQKIIANDSQSFYSQAAWSIAGEILQKAGERTTLGFATDAAALGVYDTLISIHRAHPFDVSRVCVFGMDEIAHVSRAHASSHYSALRNRVVEPLGLYEENFFMPVTCPESLERECRAYEDVIAARGGIDLLVVVMGKRGELGMCRPGTPLNSSAFVRPLDKAQKERIRQDGAAVAEKEPLGLSLGLKNMMHARKVLLLVEGRDKAEMVREALSGPVTDALPTSVLQLHPFLRVILDREAAALL